MTGWIDPNTEMPTEEGLYVVYAEETATGTRAKHLSGFEGGSFAAAEEHTILMWFCIDDPTPEELNEL